MNSVNVIGRIVNEPEVRTIGDSRSVCDLRFAIDDFHGKEKRSDFINVTVFGNQADLCKRYLRKGFLAGVQGRIRTEVYKDKEGNNRYPVKVVADRVLFLQWPDRVEGEQDAAPEAGADVLPEEADQEVMPDVLN